MKEKTTINTDETCIYIFNTIVSIGVVSFMVGCWLRPLAVAIAIVTPFRDGRDFVAARMNSP
jgi:hypothetical protein